MLIFKPSFIHIRTNTKLYFQDLQRHGTSLCRHPNWSISISTSEVNPDSVKKYKLHILKRAAVQPRLQKATNLSLNLSTVLVTCMPLDKSLTRLSVLIYKTEAVCLTSQVFFLQKTNKRIHKAPSTVFRTQAPSSFFRC